MSHPFGDLISQYLHRKHGLSQAKLAEGILQDPSIIGKMCKGKRLNGVQARERVCAIIDWLRQQAVLMTVDEANGLLNAAGMAALRMTEPTEAQLLQQLNARSSAPTLSTLPHVPVTSKPRSNLPASLTSFMGRAEAMTEIAQRVVDHRLVTLTGAGGVGKTRLAVETARTFVESQAPASALFPDGIWLVELAALGATDVGTTVVAQALVQRFKLTEQDSRSPLETLHEYFANKYLLLVLDNCEHLVDGCAEVCATLLQHCWQLHILTTSREELRIPGEMLYPVPPLTLPASTASDPSDVLTSAATQLFVERMHSTPPGFAIQPDDIAHLVHICRQLDGIPLALELAAPLVRTMSLAEIAQQLDNQMALLTNRYRTAIPRHQTMYSALVWSYHLLSPEEQQLLARASVFAGGWTLEAAQAVCADRASAVTQTAIATLLQQLNDKSWVLIESVNEQRRYRLLEPVRQFAAQQLVGNAAVQQVQRQHSHYYLHLLAQQEERLAGPEQLVGLKLLRTDLVNVSTAWHWAVDQHEFDSLCPAVHALFLFCDITGSFYTGVSLFAQAEAELRAKLADMNTTQSTLQALWVQVLIRLGACEVMQGTFADGKQHLQDSLLSGIIDQDRALALAYLGKAADEQGELTLAVARFQESLTISQRCNDVAGTAYALGLAGGNSAGYAEACSLCSESLELWHKVGRPDRIANLSNMLAWKLCCSGDYAAANAHWREGLALCEQLDLPNEKAWVLDCLGFVSWYQSDLVAAEQYFQEALAIYTTLGRQNMVSMCKAEYSLVLVDKGQIEQAFVLVREAVAMARQVNSQMFLILSLNYLGAALIVTHDFGAARRALCESIERAWKHLYFDHLLTAFYYFAELLIHESKVSALPSTREQQGLALTLLSCVQNQSLAWQMFKDKAAQLQAKLEDILPADMCAIAIARGQNASVAEMVTTLLEVV